jgi:hypothetical protein
VQKLNKKADYEYSFELLKPKSFEIWARVDSMGRNIIYQDSEYKISIDNYIRPTLLKLYYNKKGRDMKVGELVCNEKNHLGKSYVSLKYIDIQDNHKGKGFSFRMINSLLSILNCNIEGIITNFDSRKNSSSILKLFTTLGGYKNDFGYLQIKNPKHNA